MCDKTKLDPDETIRICDYADETNQFAEIIIGSGPSAQLTSFEEHMDTERARAYAEEVQYLRGTPHPFWEKEVNALREANVTLNLANEALQDRVDLHEEPFGMTIEQCEEETGLPRGYFTCLSFARRKVIDERASEAMRDVQEDVVEVPPEEPPKETLGQALSAMARSPRENG